MVLGAKRAQFKGNILGISVDRPAEQLKSLVAKLAEETSIRLGDKINFSPADILVNSDYTGAGYGIMGRPEKEAIHLFARKEGLLLDPVYTGRAAAGLIDLIHKGFFKPEEKVLFWHTGGTPALFTKQYSQFLAN